MQLKLVRLLQPVLPIGEPKGEFKKDACESPVIEVQGTGFSFGDSSGALGATIPLQRVVADLENGWRLVSPAATVDVTGGQFNREGSTTKYSIRLLRWRIVRGRERARFIEAYVHGWPGGHSLRQRRTIGPYEVAALAPADVCKQADQAGVWSIRRLDGKFISMKEAFATIDRLCRIAEISLNQALSVENVIGFAAKGTAVWQQQGPYQPHFPAVLRPNCVSLGNIEGVAASLDVMSRVWEKWELLDTSMHLGTAVGYLSRGCASPFEDHQARDFVVALECMVKQWTKARRMRDSLAGLLEAFERPLGFAVSSAERMEFVAWRNCLAHEGTLGVRGTPADRFQSIGWLRTFVTRHICAALGWKGEIIDFGCVPWKQRAAASRRFAGPKLCLS